MKSTTNVEFIATYIFYHPGARHVEIMRALRKWRGISDMSWGRRNTWGRQYFSRYAQASNRYLDVTWKTVVPGKPRSGYILTPLGLSKVRRVITQHRNGSNMNLEKENRGQE